MTGLEDGLVELDHNPVKHDHDQQRYISPSRCLGIATRQRDRPRRREQIATPTIQDNSGQRAIHASRNIHTLC
jgi:hypothetical protein